MDKSDIVFGVFLTTAIIFLVLMIGSSYYPAHDHTITVERIVSNGNWYGVVSTDGEFFIINFKTFATVEVGSTYSGVVTHPWFSDQYIDHLIGRTRV
jgi:hypothetical protein